MTKPQTDKSPVKDQPGEAQDQTETESQLQELQAELASIQEREKRALADYQNLVRRHRQDRLQLARYANQELLVSLLQPLEHLNLAAKKITDEGLAMVVKDLWQVLKEEGLTELDPKGQEFDETTMEAVNADPRLKEDKADQVKKQKPLIVAAVIKPGYKLHDRVLQHAKVEVKVAD